MLLPGAEQWEERCDEPEERLDRLVEFVVELASGRLEARMAPSTRADAAASRPKESTMTGQSGILRSAPTG